jgi:hypothetical protein
LNKLRVKLVEETITLHAFLLSFLRKFQHLLQDRVPLTSNHVIREHINGGSVHQILLGANGIGVMGARFGEPLVDRVGDGLHLETRSVKVLIVEIGEVAPKLVANSSQKSREGLVNAGVLVTIGEIHLAVL